jgi:hypothetical protein
LSASQCNTLYKSQKTEHWSFVFVLFSVILQVYYSKEGAGPACEFKKKQKEISKYKEINKVLQISRNRLAEF